LLAPRPNGRGYRCHKHSSGACDTTFFATGHRVEAGAAEPKKIELRRAVERCQVGLPHDDPGLGRGAKADDGALLHDGGDGAAADVNLGVELAM